MITKKLILTSLVIITILGFFSFINILKKINNQPVAVIVPHHDVVKTTRRELLTQIAQKRPATNRIVLLSPDHFSPQQQQVSIANKDWNIKGKTLEFDREFGDKLLPFLNLENGITQEDHGITNILNDIIDLWPNAKITPIIIGQNLKFEDLGKLDSAIKENCLEDCLLIASVDFSHYLPFSLADIHDLKTLSALESQDLQKLSESEVDSPQSLIIAASLSSHKNAHAWNLFAHTNSSKIVNSPDSESTGHIFGWYQKGEKTESEKLFTFTFSTKLSPENNKTSLGERFFYGVDEINTNLNSEYNFADKITIKPTEGKSELQITDQVIVFLGSDLTISGSIDHDKIKLVLLPIKRQDNQAFFLKNQEKIDYINKLLSTLERNKGVKVNFSESTIEIDKNLIYLNQ